MSNCNGIHPISGLNNNESSNVVCSSCGKVVKVMYDPTYASALGGGCNKYNLPYFFEQDGRIFCLKGPHARTYRLLEKLTTTTTNK